MTDTPTVPNRNPSLTRRATNVEDASAREIDLAAARFFTVGV